MPVFSTNHCWVSAQSICSLNHHRKVAMRIRSPKPGIKIAFFIRLHPLPCLPWLLIRVDKKSLLGDGLAKEPGLFTARKIPQNMVSSDFHFLLKSRLRSWISSYSTPVEMSIGLVKRCFCDIILRGDWPVWGYFMATCAYWCPSKSWIAPTKLELLKTIKTCDIISTNSQSLVGDICYMSAFNIP